MAHDEQNVRLQEIIAVVKRQLQFFKEENNEHQRPPRAALAALEGQGFNPQCCVTQLPQLAFPALPPTANICHFHTQLKAQETSHKLHTCTHDRHKRVLVCAFTPTHPSL